MENNNLKTVATKNDEIVESLKRFGIKSTYESDNHHACQSLQEIMQDFALNEVVFKEVKANAAPTVWSSHMMTTFNNIVLISNIKMKKTFKKIYKNGKNLNYKSCVFCANNKEPEAVYNSHSVRDSEGKVLCPKLRTYVCPICGASGDNAHTVKYCPEKKIITMEDTLEYENNRAAFVKQKVKY